MPNIERAKRDLQLVRGQIWPRRHQIAVSPVLLFALLAGVFTSLIAGSMPAGTLKISDVVTNGFTFASISMGVCVTSLVLSLGLPGTKRLQRWARIPGLLPEMSALSDLIFSLAWAALAQLGLIGVCVLASLFGGTLPLAPPQISPVHWLGLATGLFVFFYALFELAIVVQTLVQIGVLIIAEENSTDQQ